MKYILYPIHLILVLAICLSLHTSALAQSADDNALLQITSVNDENFPEISVSAYADLGAGKNILSQEVVLQENGVTQPIIADEGQEIGVQIGIAIDPNNFSADLFDTAEKSVRALADSTIGWSPQTDWFAAFTIDPSTNLAKTIIGWDNFGLVANGVTQYYEGQDRTYTGNSIYALLNYTLDQFEASREIDGIHPGIQKFLVLFTDATSSLSDQGDLQDLLNRAEEMNVRIYPVKLGEESGFPDTARSLQQLANTSGGEYIDLASHEESRELWEELAGQRSQRILVYRTTTQKAKDLTLTLPRVTVEGGPLTVRASAPETILEPFEIMIVQPVANEERNAVDMQNGLPIELVFTWPNGVERQLAEVVYTLNGPTGSAFDSQRDNFGNFVFPINELSPGSYLLEVEATDIYGVPAAPQKVNFTVNASSAQEGAAGNEEAIDGSMVADTSAETSSAGADGSSENGSNGNVIPFLSQLGIPSINRTTGTVVAFLVPLFLLFVFYWWRRTRRFQAVPSPAAAGSYSPTQSVTPPSFVSDNNPFEDEEEEAVTEVALNTQPPINNQQLDGDEEHTEISQLPGWAYPGWLVYEKVEDAEDGEFELPKKIPLTAINEQTVGRSRSLNDIVVNAKFISRQHATITTDKKHYHIRDEGSAGGTFVNRKRLGIGEEMLLKDGDIINLNRAVYRVEISEEEVQEQNSTDIEAPAIEVPAIENF